MSIKRLCLSKVRVIRPVGSALILTIAAASSACVTGKIDGNRTSDAFDSSSPDNGFREVTPGGAAGTDASPRPVAAGAAGAAGAASPAAARYTLVIDHPTDRASVSGIVTISGRAEGFTTVQVLDERGAILAQVAPHADGTFTAQVDSSALGKGATTWTVNAHDAAPGADSAHSAQVELALSIEPTPSCDGQSCSGHGTCVLAPPPVCQCDPGYHRLGALECAAGVEDPGSAWVPAGYHLTFSDEFASATLDTVKWNTRAPWNVKWYADSKQMQAFIPEAVSLKDGLVTFTADHSQGNTDGQPYASGSITSNRTFTYGYLEARVSLPAGKGLWPAYWLTSSVRWPPEIDIFEVVDGVAYGYTHVPQGGSVTFVEGAAGADAAYPLPNPYGVYHVYGLHWTATDLYRYVDGVLTQHDKIDAAAGSGDPFWLNLSLQVGGNWPGSPDASTPFPSYMNIDYVRVYEQ